MHSALVRAGLGEQVPITPALTLRALLFITPGTLAASKMLERLFLYAADEKRAREPVRDLEFRCLRALADYNDTIIDETGASKTMLFVMAQMHRISIFDSDMRTVLQSEHSALSALPAAPTAARVRLRDAVRAVKSDKTCSGHTFGDWLLKQRFVSTMSKHLQYLLYFINVQVEPVSKDAYSHHFSGDVLARMTTVPIQEIDPDAVLRVIRSIRVCFADIPDLITFRSTCLLGINSTRRIAITLPQVLQLYVASFQHKSIRQRCWCAVIDTWNHTIVDALKRFHENHNFAVSKVIDTVIKCQLSQYTEAY
jgi:hypothetical protein